jgi:hypothetical protein
MELRILRAFNRVNSGNPERREKLLCWFNTHPGTSSPSSWVRRNAANATRHHDSD